MNEDTEDTATARAAIASTWRSARPCATNAEMPAAKAKANASAMTRTGAAAPKKSCIVPTAAVIRTRDEREIAKADIAIDVGGVFDPDRFRFDHHQREILRRAAAFFAKEGTT